MGREFDVVLPTLLDELAAEAPALGAIATRESLEEVRTKATLSARMPKNLGTLSRSLVVTDVSVTEGNVTAEIEVAGAAARYGAVQEFGRRPNARGPSWRHLFSGPGLNGTVDGWRSGWVNRRLRTAVVELAGILQAEAVAARKGGQRSTARGLGVTRTSRRRETYERQACFVLARAIARKIHARGMQGRRFVGVAARNYPRRFKVRFFRAARAAGFTGGVEQ